jgi:exopolysaccharide biosynthesis protein
MAMRSLLMKVFFLGLVLNSVAQQDSAIVANAKWKTKKVAKGIKLTQYWFNGNLFGNSRQNINILEVKRKKKIRLDVGAEPQVLKGTSTFGKESEAIAALNGTFFDMKNGGSVDYIRIDGKMLNPSRLQKNNIRALHQKSAVIIDGRKLRIEKWDSTDTWEENLQGEDIMVTGPLLIQNNQLDKLDSTDMYTVRHPRTAIAIKGRKVLLVTVDGRNERASGMSLFELARFLKWLGASDAINLDGGGSTTLWVKGEPAGGIINFPSDNKKLQQTGAYKPGMDLGNLPADQEKWDHSGERPVANVILVSRKN